MLAGALSPKEVFVILKKYLSSLATKKEDYGFVHTTNYFLI